MFKNLRTSTKLILLCMMFLISVAVTTYSLLAEKQLAIAFARKELIGSKFIAALRPVYVEVLTNRPFNPSASELEASADSALKTLLTTQSEAAATLQIGPFLDSLSNQLIHLGSTFQANESASGTQVLAKMQQLAARAGDSSNLALDTDLDTYYVQNIVVDQLPKLLGRLGELQIVPAQSPDGVTSTSETKVRFLVLDGLIKSTIEEINNNLKAAYRGNADTTLRQAVESHYSAMFSAVDTYLDGRRVSILDANTPQANNQDLQHSWETVLESANQVWIVSQGQLDRLLELRIDKLVTRMDLSLIITSALVALSIIIAIVTYRQIVQPLERLEKVASMVRKTGNYDVRVGHMYSNEIGRVALAFDGMLAELASARDRERSEQSELARVARLTTMGVMTASIAHEINQPLAAIVSSGNAALHCVGFRMPRLVIGNFVVDVGLVECFAAELGEFGPLICRLLAQGLAGVVVLRGDAEFFHQRQRFLVHRLVISLHVVSESEDVLILAFLLGLFRGGNVELAGSVGDMRDLCVVGLRSLRKHHTRCEQSNRRKRDGKP